MDNNSSALMCNDCISTKSGNFVWKNRPLKYQPQPVRQASLENMASGFDHSSKSIIDTPLYIGRKWDHQIKSFFLSLEEQITMLHS